MTNEEKEIILQEFLKTVEQRNYIQQETASDIGRYTEYDFQLQTLLAVITMVVEGKNVPAGLEHLYEAIISYKGNFEEIESAVESLNNDDVVEAINNISFEDVITSIEELYNRTDNLEQGQQATIQVLSNIVEHMSSFKTDIIEKMNNQQDVTVQAFNNICEKLDKIVENTASYTPQPEPDPEPTPQPDPTPHSKVPQFETLIVKTSKNGISSDGCWYFDDRYSTLKNAVGKLKLDGSKEIIPAENAIITTTIKYKDVRTGNYQVWNGGFEYNAPYNYKKSKRYTTVQKSRTTTVTTTPKQKTVVKSVGKNTKSTSHNVSIWNNSKPIQNEQPKVVNNEVSVTPKKQTRNQVAITTTNPTIWYNTQNKPKVVTPKPVKHKKSAPVISVVEKTQTVVKPQISKAELKEWRNTWWRFIQVKVNEQDIPKCMGPLLYKWELEPHWIKLKNRISEYENKIKELQQKNSLLNMREINEIIVHCSATPEGKDYTVGDITKWHKARGFNTIGYHYVIYRDGSIHEGRNLGDAGAHCQGHNANSIGVCYIGGLSADGKTAKDTRTPEQKAALLKLLSALNEVFPATKHNIFGHRDFANKACPSFDATMEYNNL